MEITGSKITTGTRFRITNQLDELIGIVEIQEKMIQTEKPIQVFQPIRILVSESN